MRVPGATTMRCVLPALASGSTTLVPPGRVTSPCPSGKTSVALHGSATSAKASSVDKVTTHPTGRDVTCQWEAKPSADGNVTTLQGGT
eukprot:8923543-Pyramimonas_sp.AAC.1